VKAQVQAQVQVHVQVQMSDSMLSSIMNSETDIDHYCISFATVYFVPVLDCVELEEELARGVGRWLKPNVPNEA
jgi:hypothetical protein